jgi:ribosomal protein S6
MINYEMILVLNPEIEEKEQKEIIKDIHNFIKTSGKVTRKEVEGPKNLAYDIKGFKKGIFVYIDFELNTDTNEYAKAELERKLRLTNKIIKFMVMREVQ